MNSVAPCSSILVANAQQPEPEPEPPTCRICADPANHEDPLFSPCACRGSMALVHVSCLQAWIQSRFRMSHEQPLRCEICAADFNIELRTGYSFEWASCCRPQTIFFLIFFLLCLAAIAVSVVFVVGIFFVVGLALAAVFFGLATFRSLFCREIVEIRPREYHVLLFQGDFPVAAMPAPVPRIEAVASDSGSDVDCDDPMKQQASAALPKLYLQCDAQVIEIDHVPEIEMVPIIESPAAAPASPGAPQPQESQQ